MEYQPEGRIATANDLRSERVRPLREDLQNETADLFGKAKEMKGSQSIGEALMDFLRENQLEQPLLERRAVALWAELMGSTVANLTRSVDIEKGVLKVKLSSSALRQQLFECRFELVKKFNQALGAEVIKDVRLS